MGNQHGQTRRECDQICSQRCQPNSGAHIADKATTTEVHSTKRWGKLGVGQMNDGEDWTPIDITNDPTLRLDEGATDGSGVSTIEKPVEQG